MYSIDACHLNHMISLFTPIYIKTNNVITKSVPIKIQKAKKLIADDTSRHFIASSESCILGDAFSIAHPSLMLLCRLSCVSD